jgi:rhamnosyltransferase
LAIQPPTAFPPLPPEVRVEEMAASDGGAAGVAGEVAADLAALVITFERPDGLRRLVASLVEQTTRPARVVVFDNGGDPATADAVRRLAAAGCETLLLTPPRNHGPAGATAMAMSLLFTAGPPAAEWLAVLNDDLVFSHPAILAEMLAFARASWRDDVGVAAVGRIGHRFDRRWARLRRPPEADLPVIPPAVEVDYLTTGSTHPGVGQPVPMFRLSAVREVGPFWAGLFIGMTEVEFGLRLRRGGYRLLANGAMWRQPPPPGTAEEGPARPVVRTPQRRYYSTRNLVAVTRVYGRWWTPGWVTASRAGARLVGCLRRPGRTSWRHLRATLLALADGWRGRLGERKV